MNKLPRAYRLTALLALVAWVLALVAGVEWIIIKRYHRASMARSSGHAARVDEKVAPSGLFALPEEDKYVELTQRPLFMENRKPGRDMAAEPPVVDVKPPTPMQFKLMGIVKTPGERVALLLDGKGKYKRVRANDSLDGWLLVEVQDDRVSMQQGDKREQLELLKKHPKPASSPGAPGASGQPSQPARPGQPPPRPGQPPPRPSPPVSQPLDENLPEDGMDGQPDMSEDMGEPDAGE